MTPKPISCTRLYRGSKDRGLFLCKGAVLLCRQAEKPCFLDLFACTAPAQEVSDDE